MTPVKSKMVMLTASRYEDGALLYTVQHGTFVLYHGPSLEEALTFVEPVLNLVGTACQKSARKTGAHSA